ncbi:hypothetical protein OC844_005955, partial [Tilletia horrida]
DAIERVEPEQAETSSTPAPAEQDTEPVQKKAVEAEEAAKPAAEAVKDTAEGAVAAVGAAIGALSLNGGQDGVATAGDRSVAAAVAEDHGSEAQTEAKASEQPSKSYAEAAGEPKHEAGAATSASAAVSETQHLIAHSKKANLKAAADADDDEIAQLEPNGTQSEHQGLDVAAGAVAAIPAGIIDASMNVGSATGSVMREKAEEKVDDVAPNLVKGPPIKEAATAAGAPQVETSPEVAKTQDTKQATSTSAQLDDIVERAKSFVPVILGGDVKPSVSGEGFSSSQIAEEEPAPAEEDTTTPRAGGSVIKSIKSAAQAAASKLPGPSSSRGGVSGEGLDTSALPTPAIEKDLGPVAQIASGGSSGSNGDGLPSSDSQIITSKIQEALADELPKAKRGRHGRINSIDLSGELYIDGALSQPRFEEIEQQQGGPTIANRFYAAFGAVLELMR